MGGVCVPVVGLTGDLANVWNSAGRTLSADDVRLHPPLRIRRTGDEWCVATGHHLGTLRPA